MRYCLIIDDTDQRDEILLLESKSSERNFPIKCYYFNPSKRECQRLEKKADGSVEYVLDLDLILQELRKEQFEQVDLIATDYKLSDESVTGLDIVKHLKENNWRGKTPFVIFSGDHKEIKAKLQSQISPLIDNVEELNIFLENYFETNPSKIFPRKIETDGNEKSYTDYIYEYIKTHKTSLNQKLSEKLNQYPNHVFENIFPRFNDAKLERLAKIVLENTIESDEFESEFLERSIAHFIFLEK
jgi:CheY-like chemotaxis protein